MNLFRKKLRLSDQVLHDLIGVTPFWIRRISAKLLVQSELWDIEQSRTLALRWWPLLPTGCGKRTESNDRVVFFRVSIDPNSGGMLFV